MPDMPDNPPTIRQLAALAGVSRTTVSLALRNHPSIGADTRKRIQKLAEEKGYRMDPLVSSLMNRLRVSRVKRTTERIAYLTFWDTPNDWRENVNEFGYYQGACRRALHLGYEIEHFWAKEPKLTYARLSRILYNRGIRGVLLAPLPQHLGHVSLEWRYFSCAALSLTILKPLLHRASHNYREGMMLALRTLKRYGYRRFGFANSAMFDQRIKHGWLSGFLTYQYEMPVNQRVPPLLLEEWRETEEWRPNSQLLQTKFSKWLDKYQPDVVISNTLHPLAHFKSLGLRVPEDIGYVSLHRLGASDPWAGIDRLSAQIGAAAVDMVASQLQNNEFGLPEYPKTVQLDGLWCDGPTVVNRFHLTEADAPEDALAQPAGKSAR